MKKTSLFDGPSFVFRKLRGLAAACAATALVSALPLTARADDAIADQKAIAANMNRKGFDLFKLVSGKDTKENAFISPYSIDSAFGLVYCGASGKTAQEIRDTLGLPADPAECGKFFHEVSQEYEANKLIEVLVSNSVWYEQKYDDLILPSFIKMIGQYYGGTFFKEDFEKKDALVSKVNAYVEDHTKNMIKDLLSPSDITPKSFMILLNTLFFEAKWKTPFKKDDTKPMIFRNFDGKEKRVKMMYRRGRDIAYYSSEEDNVHAVVLPYEDTRFDLVALMPIQPGADRGETAMNNIIAKIGGKLDDWLKNRSPYETRLWLPIVDLTCKYSLKDALGELGMETPFDDKKADFFGIAQRSERLKYIWIEKVIHKTALKMDEEKTQAAAATAISMGGMGGAAQPPPVNIFRADRPYLVLIRDNQTGLILFAGRINDPGVEATEADGPVTPSFEGMPFPGFGMPPFQQRSNGGFGPPVEGPARTTVPGATVPGAKPAAQTIPRQVTTTTKPGSATEQKSESAAAKVDGQISVILEGFIDGADAFVFRDNKVFLQHKSFKEPAELTVNGKPWADPDTPFELGFTPDPAATKFACEGRGQKSMSRTSDSVTVTIYDQDGAAARYRIILFQPEGVKEPLELPKDPIGNTVKEVPARTKPAAATQTAKPSTAAETTASVEKPSEPGVLVLEGTFEGSGAFLFMGNMIAYSHKDGEYPADVKVDGKPWTDLTKPLKLDEAGIPVRIIRKEARGTVTLLPAEDFARLELDDYQDASASYRIEFGTKNAVPTASPSAGQQAGQQAKPEQNADVKPESLHAAPSAEPGVIVLEGKLAGEGRFFVRKDSISYLGSRGRTPTDVKVNGTPWPDLKQPILLDGDSGFIPVRIGEMEEMYITAALTPDTEKAVLELSSASSREGFYRIELAGPKTASAAAPVVIEGTFNGIGTFRFNGSRISYHHIAFMIPRNVTVNGKPWQLTSGRGVYWASSGGGDPNPDFDLGFIPDFRTSQIVGQPDLQKFALTKDDDGMELYVSDLKQEPKKTQIRIEAENKAASAPSADRAEITIQATGGQGAFSFRKNRVVFTPTSRKSARTYPKNVTVNDTSWTDLSTPFKLDYLPGLGTAKVLEATGSGFVRTEKRQDNIDMVFDNSSVFRGTPTRFIVDVEKRPLPAPDARFSAEIRADMDYAAAGFRFQGRTVTYWQLSDKTAKNVTVNGKPWTDLDKPFELNFEVDPLRAQVMDRIGACTFEQLKHPDSYMLRVDNTGPAPCGFVAELNGDEPEAAANDSQETVTIGMEFRGSGRMTFRDNRIYFKLFSGGYPGELTVNGKPWDDPDLPFELDFVPEFSTAKIAAMKTLGAAAELTAEKDRAELFLNTSGSLRSYQLDLAMKKRNDAVPGAAPAATEPETSTASAGTGHMGFAGIGPFSPGAAANMVDPNETIVFEVTTDKGCTFTFADDTILCEVPQRVRPDDNVPLVTLNGRLLNDLGKPIVLNFIPDLAHADVTVSFERRSRITGLADSPVQIRRENGKMTVTTLEMNVFSHESASYSVRIAMKKLADSKRDPAAGERLTMDDPKRLANAGQIQNWSAMMQGIVNAMEGVQLRSLDFDAEVAGTGVFEFFGDRITYRHESGERPSGVTVGGKTWENLDEPFEMPFVADNYHETLSYRYAVDSPVAAYPYKPVSVVGDRGRAYLATRGIAGADGGTPCRYHVRYVMSELNLSKARKDRPPKAVTGQVTVSGVRMPARDAGTAPDMATVVIEGVLDGRGSFVVEGNTISHNNATGKAPTRVTVNGKLWTDLAKPFELDFIPEFPASAKMVETRGRITPMLASLSQKVEVTYNDSGDFYDFYRIVFTMKKKTDGK